MTTSEMYHIRGGPCQKRTLRTTTEVDCVQDRLYTRRIMSGRDNVNSGLRSHLILVNTGERDQPAQVI